MNNNNLTESHAGQHTDCVKCKQKKKFTMPEELISAVISGNFVVFAGAGISTENRDVFYWTLYEEIKEDAGIDDVDMSFSEVMEAFEQKFDKKELLNRIKKRFDYVEAFPELYRKAVSFHKELSTIHTIKEIITTNWDDYFERECGAIPIVTDEDFAFWELPQRKVLKLHGTVSSYGSIVATKKEYRRKYKELRDGVIGAKLKLSLATKTFVFFGYSFNDEDFTKIHRFLIKSMGDIKPKIYIVSPNKKDPIKLKKLNAVGIDTDGTFFLKELKEILTKQKKMIPEENFVNIYMGLDMIWHEHSKLGKEPYMLIKNPESLYLASYQDGIIHAFERILAMKKDGSYSCPHCIIRLIQSYEKGIKEKRKEKLYHDVAYFEGYKTGLYVLLDNKIVEDFPMYYLYGIGPIDKEKDYLKLSKKADTLHKSAYKWAQGWIKYHNIKNSDTVFQHLPFA